MERTPMLEQYYRLREKYKDHILFFRLGDFYEMFGEDAKKVSALLGLTLTRRQDAPMCGVPYHSAARYIKKLLSLGYTVALCEQVGEEGKKLMRREVVRIFTPGTVIEEELADSPFNSFVVSVVPYDRRKKTYLVYADVSTGETYYEELDSHRVAGELGMEEVKEILVEREELDWLQGLLAEEGVLRKRVVVRDVEEFGLREFARSLDLSEADGSAKILAGDPNFVRCLYLLWDYVREVFVKSELQDLFKDLKVKRAKRFLQLSPKALESLGIFGEGFTLFNFLNRCVTPMGSRCLRRTLSAPFARLRDINGRLNGVAELVEKEEVRRRIRGRLEGVGDAERYYNSLLVGEPNLEKHLRFFYRLKKILELRDVEFEAPLLKECVEALRGLDAVEEEYTARLSLEEDRRLKKGYSLKYDEALSLLSHLEGWLREYEERLRRELSIPNLRVDYNNLLGYFVHITKKHLDKVPVHFERIQSLKGAERFRTPELLDLRNKVEKATLVVEEVERKAAAELKSVLELHKPKITYALKMVGELDLVASLAEVAVSEGYVRPEVHDGKEFEIRSGRHPLVEYAMRDTMGFIPNDTYLGGKYGHVHIITGPNMAGKSTYLRQVALIGLMAHLGSYVPAKSARVPLLDAIFTRIGASDDIVRGASTFKVEMDEVAEILRNFTDRSLIVMDEVGRGTGTFDGLAISAAVLEFLLSSKAKPAVLFSTHFHELTKLAGKFGDKVRFYRMDVRVRGDRLIFKYKVVEGVSEKSYGIQVARSSGVPAQVVDRAQEILQDLEKKELEIKEMRKKFKTNLFGEVE